MMVKRPFYGVLLILLIALLGAIAGTQAQGQPGSSFVAPVMYEVVLTNDGPAEVQWASLEAPVPPGSVYVGLAAGSHVGTEAEQQGDLLIWSGPFSVPPGGELVLRYWLAPAGPALQTPPMEVTARKQSGETLPLGAQPAEPVSPDRAIPEDAASPEAVTVEKTADTLQVTPDDHPWIVYEVTFTNSNGSPAVLDQISDTLATGFQFGGMAYGSDLGDPPVDPHASPIVWQGPFTVPAGGTFELRYWVKVSMVQGDHVNSVEATGDGVPVGPDTATVTVLVPNLSLAKDAAPLSVTVGDMVTYDITIANTGGYRGVIDVVSDTLPAGFTFLSMDPGSDVGEPTSLDPLVWTTPFTVPASSDVHLIYQARAGEVGNSTNSVIARDNHGEQVGQDEKTVEVLPSYAFLPAVLRNFTTTTLPMEEEFTTHIPPEWVPFVNYPELEEDQWYYRGDHATWGRYEFNAGEPLSQWALSMYLGEGAEQWTDYKIEATLRADKAWRSVSKLIGIWFRGTHERRTDNQGGDVTGYLFLLKPDDDWRYAKAYLSHIDPNTRKLNYGVEDRMRLFWTDVNIWYDITIEVRGANIKIWVEEKGSGLKRSVFNWTDPDATWKQGTVGFVMFRGAAAFDSIRVTPLD